MTKTRPTLADVAAAAGVSRMTVSNAYNRPDQLSAATRQRVLAAADGLGYAGPNPAARSLRRGRAGAVGVLITESLPYAFADPGILELLRGVAGALGDAGHGLLLVPTLDSPDGLTLVRDSVVDAFVLISVAGDDPAVAAVQARRLPVVTVGNPHLRGVPHLGVDNRRSAGVVARHLLDLGHRRLAVVTPAGRERPSLDQRAVGFRDTVDAALGSGSTTVVVADSNDRPAGRAAAARLLGGARRGRPTAVFTVTDVLALGVLDEAATRAVDVPAELSVAGYDDVAEAARAVPPLTTVHQSLYEQGRAAATAALALSRGETPRLPRLRTELVLRGSTGPAPASRR
jgi:DNA-binding LacI/PurR family transcriptional regulator